MARQSKALVVKVSLRLELTPIEGLDTSNNDMLSDLHAWMWPKHAAINFLGTTIRTTSSIQQVMDGDPVPGRAKLLD